MKTLGYDQPLYILPFDHRRNGATLSAVYRNFRTRLFFMKQAASKQQRNP